jgi:hypothetical protein
MNKKSVTFPFVVWIAAAVISPLYSQNAGFQIGQSQPSQSAQLQNPPATSGPILIAPMGSPIQPTGNPILPLSGTMPRQPATSASARNGAITILPAGGTVFVPAGTFVIESGADMQPGAFLSAPLSPSAHRLLIPGIPLGSGGGGTSIDRSNRGTNIGQQASPPDVTRLALGTSREKVIEKYGNPIAFIMNMNGETLYFRGGVVVFIKDGVVAVPTVSDNATRR